LLKALKTPLYLKVERLYKLEQKDKNLDQLNVMEQVPPEMANRKFFCSFISGDTFTLSTILFHKYIKDSQI
jgi:hypothetical protein